MIDEAMQEVRAWCAKPGNRKRHLAREAKLHFNSLKFVAAPDWDPRVSTLRALVEAIKRIEQPVE